MQKYRMVLASVSLDKSMNTGHDQICSFVLGDSSLKLMMLLGCCPKHRDSSWLLERAMSVHEDLSLALALALPLPNVSLLSSGLLADG